MAETPRDIQKRTVRIVGILIVVLGVVFFMIPAPVLAQETTLGSFVANLIFTAVISPVSALMDFLLYILVEVSQYNGFADAPIVTKGWTVLRDLSNMFFVLILLVIAISSIVKWQTVNYRQNLRRLILMALLINFSKTIVVFFIDLSQVITLTFISAVKDVLQAGVVTALGLDKMVSPISGGGVSGFAGDLFTFVVAAIAFCVATLVVAVILILFLGRIIALWLILVFAPLAFLASTLPQTKEWYDKWWKTLGSNLTLAPVLAFMLWLVFAVIADPTGGTGGQIQIAAGNGDAANKAATEVATVGGIASSSLVGFMVAIGLLMYSIKLGVQMSTVGGSVAQKFASKVQGGAAALGKRVAWGKSGQGGIAGRAKAGALGVTQRLGTAASTVPVLGRLGTRVAEGSAIALSRQDEVRDKAERERLRRMTPEQRQARIQQQAAREGEGVRAAISRFGVSRAKQRATQLESGESGEAMATRIEALTPGEQEAANASLRQEVVLLRQAEAEATAGRGPQLNTRQQRRLRQLQIGYSRSDGGHAFDSTFVVDRGRATERREHAVDARIWAQHASTNSINNVLTDAVNGDGNREHQARYDRLQQDAHAISSASATRILTSDDVANENRERYLGALANTEATYGPPPPGSPPGTRGTPSAQSREAARIYRDLRQSTATSNEVESRLNTWAPSTTPHAGRDFLRGEYNEYVHAQMQNRLGRFQAGDIVNAPGNQAGAYIGPSRTNPRMIQIQVGGGVIDVNFDVFMQLNSSQAAQQR